GGAQLLQSFFDAGCWDEARVITNETLRQPGGIPAPQAPDMMITESYHLDTDRICFYKPTTR
ncbi:MAG: riboflavin biosynthesis protein RibD, partial [Bacteroidetes bacterium]|nr:riboflavin biosynthesis protein RibD [Bacteroidota bacterium]